MCSGTSPDDRLVEVIELPDHPFFMASQYHPEFKSRPNRPEPLFREFVGAALERARERGSGRARQPRKRQAEIRAERGRRRRRGAGAHAAGAAERGQDARARHAALSGRPARRDVRAALRDPEPERARGATARELRCESELEALGLDVDGGRHGGRDRAPACGNLVARDPGPGGRAHGDAVRPHGHGPARRPVEVELRGRRASQPPRRRSSGADNKAAVAVLLEVARRWVADAGARRRASWSSRPARRSACGARKAFDRGRAPGASSGSSSTTPRRSAAWSWRRRPTTRVHAEFTGPLGARRHPARGGPQRDRGRGAGDRRDAARAGSTTRRRRTSA